MQDDTTLSPLQIPQPQSACKAAHPLSTNTTTTNPTLSADVPHTPDSQSPKARCTCTKGVTCHQAGIDQANTRLI